MENKTSIKPTCIMATATGGADIVDCIRDAITLATEENTDVVMIHNSKSYVVDICAVVDKIYSNPKDA